MFFANADEKAPSKNGAKQLYILYILINYPRRIFHEKARRKTQTSNSQLSFATRCLTKFFLKDQKHKSIFKRPESLVEHVSTLVQTKTIRGKPQSKMTNGDQHNPTSKNHTSKVCPVPCSSCPLLPGSLLDSVTTPAPVLH